MPFFFTADLIILCMMIGSGIALAILVRRKRDVLRAVPEKDVHIKQYVEQWKEQAKQMVVRGSAVSGELVLQKVLSRIHIVILRVDRKVNDWLSSLRKRTQERKERFSENYWKQIKRSKK